jgi:hypothetical protein
MMITEDTPSQYQRDHDGSRQRSFIQNKRQMGEVSVVENPNNLSDWVLERIGKNK